jgi:hypothetical protein
VPNQSAASTLNLKFGCSPGVAAAAPQDPTANLKCFGSARPGAAAATVTAATDRGWVTVAPAAAATSQLSVQLWRGVSTRSARSSAGAAVCSEACGPQRFREGNAAVGFISRRDRDFALEPGDMPVYAPVFVYTVTRARGCDRHGVTSAMTSATARADPRIYRSTGSTGVHSPRAR